MFLLFYYFIYLIIIIIIVYKKGNCSLRFRFGLSGSILGFNTARSIVVSFSASLSDFFRLNLAFDIDFPRRCFSSVSCGFCFSILKILLFRCDFSFRR